MKLKKIAIIDCATEGPAYQCFNRLVDHFKIPMEYHLPSHHGIHSLYRANPSDAYIIFGSYSNICERLDWHKDIATFAQEKLQQGIPVLGICFGHQLMADYYKGTIDLVTKDGKLFEGTRSIKIKKDRWGLKKNEEYHVFTSHRYEIKNFPPDFEWLAESDECQYDLVCHKSLPYLGIQGHPESSWDFYESFETKLSEKEIVQASRDGLFIISRFLETAEKMLQRP